MLTPPHSLRPWFFFFFFAFLLKYNDRVVGLPCHLTQCFNYSTLSPDTHVTHGKVIIIPASDSEQGFFSLKSEHRNQQNFGEVLTLMTALTPQKEDAYLADEQTVHHRSDCLQFLDQLDTPINAFSLFQFYFFFFIQGCLQSHLCLIMYLYQVVLLILVITML